MSFVVWLVSDFVFTPSDDFSVGSMSSYFHRQDPRMYRIYKVYKKTLDC